MKIAALDVGDARIGLAVGDPDSRWVFGRGYITRKDLASDVRAVREFAEKETVGKIVVGLPLKTDGSLSVQGQSVLELVKALGEAGLETGTLDERYTTKLAQARLQQAPKRVRQEKGKLDEQAAIAILETYLASTGLEKRDPTIN